MKMLKRSFTIVLSMALLFLSVPVSHAATTDTAQPEMAFDGKGLADKELLEAMVSSEDVVPGKLIVKFTDSSALTRNRALKSMDLVQSFQTTDTGNVVEVDVSQSVNLADTMQMFSSMPEVEYVEPLYMYRASEDIKQTVSESVYWPDDTYTQKKWQWGLQAINITDTWARVSETQRNSQTIAIVDTGVDLEHPDLMANLVNGYDFVNRDTNPDDDNGHGTHVAGIAAGISGNQIGIAGVAGGAKIMPIKVLNASGVGTSLDIYLGIMYAVRQGAGVINLSLGSSAPSLLIKEAIKFALQNDVVVVAATGNDYALSVSYPAAFDGVIAVGAVDWSFGTGFTRAEFSNYGDNIDLVAPGVDILSTIPLEKDLFDDKQDGYTFKKGTSMAAPFVTGMAALLRAEDNSLTYDQVRQHLFDTAVDIGLPGWDEHFGVGIINGSMTRKIPDIIEFPHIQIEVSGRNVEEFTLSVTAYKGKGVIDAVYGGEIAVNIEQTFSNAIDGIFYLDKNPYDEGFSLEKNEASIQGAVPQGEILFDLVEGTCSKTLELVDTGYYSFSFANTMQSENYRLLADNRLYYIKGNRSEITGTITLDEPYTKDMVIYLYAINEIYADILALGLEEPGSVTIQAGQQSVPFRLELPPDRNYKLYYAIMTDNDDYQYFGFYKNTGTTLNPADYTPIDLTTGDKTGVNLTLVKTTPQNDFISNTKTGADDIPTDNLPAGHLIWGSFEFEYKGDRDYYTIVVQDTWDCIFIVLGDGFSCRGTLYDSDGNMIHSQVNAVNARLSPGLYYLKVEGETGLETGDYMAAFGYNNPTEPQLVQFTDENLKDAIYSYLKKEPDEPVYNTDVESIQQLNLNDMGITSLDGLEYFSSLQILELKNNMIDDLTPLQGLTELEVLDLSNNDIYDIYPLSDLTYLNELDVSHNDITVIPSNFKSLDQLNLLDISHNRITRLSPLASMTSIKRLFMNDNMISDIQPLSTLTLQILYLAGNPITNYSPIRNYYGALKDKDFTVLPVASNVSITGNKTKGSVLTGKYTYSNMVGNLESGTTYRWLKSATVDGDYVEIAGANAITYTVTENDLRMYLKFEVTPRSVGEPLAGLPVKSPAHGPITNMLSKPENPPVDPGGTPCDGTTTSPPEPTAPVQQPSVTPTPMPINHVEEDENGRSRIVFNVQEQDIDFDRPPVIDATSWFGVDIYNVNVPASVFTGSQKYNWPVTVQSNAFTFEIQPGTFDVSGETGTISLSADITAMNDLPDLMLPDDTDNASFVFDFNIHIDGKPVTSFNKPITITIQLDLSGISNLDKVGIWYFSETQNKWIYVGGTVNSDGTITFTIPHFTRFAAFEYTGTFTDINGHWAKEDIEIMASRQVTNGTGDGKFSPDALISRAEFTAMIVRALDITMVSDGTPFTDVQAGDWFMDAALKANAAGLIQGDANGKFLPNGMITREEMAAIAVRAYCYQTGTNAGDIITTQEVRFTDEDKASSWARRSVVLADALGLMSGLPDGTFRPKNLSTRAEAIVVIKRLMKGTGLF